MLEVNVEVLDKKGGEGQSDASGDAKEDEEAARGE
jgi:hypothetical protein